MVADEIAVTVPRGGRVLVFADLRMVPGGTDVSREASRAIARASRSSAGPGCVIFAGDVFDLVRESRPDLDAALGAHPRLAAALVGFLADPERRVVVLPGTRDAALAHDAARDRRCRCERLGDRARVRARDRHGLRRARRARRTRPSFRPVGRVRRSARPERPPAHAASRTRGAARARRERRRQRGWKASRTPTRPRWVRSSRRGSRTGGCSGARRGSRCPCSRCSPCSSRSRSSRRAGPTRSSTCSGSSRPGSSSSSRWS